MYSTSADAAIVEENKKLGAVDVIIKPSDISVLTKILTNIIGRNVVPIMAFLFAFILIPQIGFSQRESLPAVNETQKVIGRRSDEYNGNIGFENFREINRSCLRDPGRNRRRDKQIRISAFTRSITTGY